MYRSMAGQTSQCVVHNPPLIPFFQRKPRPHTRYPTTCTTYLYSTNSKAPWHVCTIFLSLITRSIRNFVSVYRLPNNLATFVISVLFHCVILLRPSSLPYIDIPIYRYSPAWRQSRIRVTNPKADVFEWEWPLPFASLLVTFRQHVRLWAISCTPISVVTTMGVFSCTIGPSGTDSERCDCRTTAISRITCMNLI